jgi:hypothetical protein
MNPPDVNYFIQDASLSLIFAFFQMVNGGGGGGAARMTSFLGQPEQCRSEKLDAYSSWDISNWSFFAVSIVVQMA